MLNNLTYSRLWGTRWPRRKAMSQRRPWQRQRASSASWGPPAWWRCQSGSGKSPACYRAAHCSDRSSPHSAVSYAESGLVKRQGDGESWETWEGERRSDKLITEVGVKKCRQRYDIDKMGDFAIEFWCFSMLETRSKISLHVFHNPKYQETLSKPLRKLQNHIQGCLLIFLKSSAIWRYHSDCSQRMAVEWRLVEWLENQQRKVPWDKLYYCRDMFRGKSSRWRRDNRNENRQVRKREEMKYNGTTSSNTQRQKATLVTVQPWRQLMMFFLCREPF